MGSPTRMVKQLMRLRGSSISANPQEPIATTNRLGPQGFLARPRQQELITFVLMMAFLFVWSIGDRSGERQVGEEC